MDGRVWLVTGGTPGGFGMAYAEAVLAAGERVVVTARRTGELAEWGAAYGDRVLVLELDVTRPEQVRQAVAAAEERFGGIDVLVNNAGRGWYGSVEGASEDLVRRSFELNFFGTVEVIRAVLPGMRRRGSGWIVNMSSVAGLIGVPGFGYYSAAKFALEGLSESLRAEVEPYGVRVLLVEPGAFRTNAYSGFSAEPEPETVPEYQEMLTGLREAFVAQDGTQPGDPERGVRAVLAVLDQADPPARLVLGDQAYEHVVAKYEGVLAELRRHEELSRGADFPPAP
ncbi:NAD(P)-dependent dehydrogenase (short-subunit alcohol dehydrogenase family) [Crossiella equi]|uniref:NAD(P)-dependent dehydrogenase (Short-subunit alcohol dehydrogenase family) n=1 Tax=Crossiella equi TaxID=130796 RepID=A0ABS5AL42_9PSEU|nr:oxidoreductase [Crossiella equi]MBP2477289.1 NAD(P)-dependent dehydrogenase (short-subunit alcohol dehydrogenase family) [Crossiella equi]